MSGTEAAARLAAAPARLLWNAILAVVLIALLVDAAGWFPDGRGRVL